MFLICLTKFLIFWFILYNDVHFISLFVLIINDQAKANIRTHRFEANQDNPLAPQDILTTKLNNGINNGENFLPKL